MSLQFGDLNARLPWSTVISSLSSF